MNEEIWETVSEKEQNAYMDGCFSYDEELKKDGHFAAGEGLQDARNAITLRWSSGKVSVTDGPFAETKEQIGGIMILEANDLNHAIRLLSKPPSLRLGRGASSWKIRPAVDLTALVDQSKQRRKT